MPIRISAGHHPGAIDKEAIGCRFGVEGKTATDLSQPWKFLVYSDPPALLARSGGMPFKDNASLSSQPRPLTIDGPRRVATPSGNLFQAATKIASLGLSGFKSGTERPGAKRN